MSVKNRLNSDWLRASRTADCRLPARINRPGAGSAEGLTWTVYDANTMTQADIYGEVLCFLGDRNPKIVGLSADLAKSTKIATFAERFPVAAYRRAFGKYRDKKENTIKVVLENKGDSGLSV